MNLRNINQIFGFESEYFGIHINLFLFIYVPQVGIYHI